MDCLVKTLKGNFTGEDNPYYKKLIIHFTVTNYDAETYLVFASSPRQNITIKKNGSILKTQVIEVSNTRVYIDTAGSSGDYELIFDNKYFITRFDWGTVNYSAQFDTADLKYSKIDSYLRCISQNITGNIKDFPEKCDTIILNSSKITGDVKYLSDYITVFSLSSTEIYGSINEMPDNIVSLNVEGTRVSGEMVELAEKRASLNKLSAISIRGNNALTYNGRQAGVANYNITFSSQTSFTITTNRQGYPTVTGTYTGGQWVISES